MTALPVLFELDTPRPRGAGRRDARRREGALDWARDAPRERAVPPATLLLRRRLGTGAVSGAEAVLPALPARMAAGHDRPAALRTVAAAALAWDGGTVAVALTAAEVQEGRAIGLAGSMLAAGLAPQRLELVLPEAPLIGLEEDGLIGLAALRDLGIGLVLDGFGAGVASLTVLRLVPLSGIKLARAVVRGLPGDADDAAMARVGIAMAHAMGLVVIADGIEAEAQRGFLAACGCDEGQGALFGPVR